MSNAIGLDLRTASATAMVASRVLSPSSPEQRGKAPHQARAHARNPEKVTRAGERPVRVPKLDDGSGAHRLDRRIPVVSCGRPLPRHDVSILGADGKPLPEGRVGEVFVQGPSVTDGYWNDEEAMARNFTAFMQEKYDVALCVLDYPREDICDQSTWAGAERGFVRAAKNTNTKAAVLSTFSDTISEGVAERLMQDQVATLAGIDAGPPMGGKEIKIGDYSGLQAIKRNWFLHSSLTRARPGRAGPAEAFNSILNKINMLVFWKIS